MKKIKLVSFTLICTIIIQIFMPILMDIDWNVVFAEDSGNKWDISKKGDGSVIAELSDDGTLTISGSGEMKNWDYNETTDWHTDENKVKVKEIIIKNGITNIGEYAFYKCSSLTNITIPKEVTSIGRDAFLSCSSLANIIIPEGVTSIGKDAFYNCSSLVNIIIPEGVTSIEGGVFWGCSSLTSITIPEGVTSIGEYAFYNCSSLENIIIPEGVTSIGNSAFRNCSSLTSIDVSENNKNYLSDEGVLYTKDKTQIIKYPERKQNVEYTIPEGVTSIGGSAFAECSSLTSITIPEGVTSIGYSAFSGCSSLTNIIIPERVTSIRDHAFYNCSSLTNITIPEGVTSIGDYAFYNCSNLTNIIIPEVVTSIGRYAFDECSSLTSIDVSENNKNYLSDEGVLYTKDKTQIIKYPERKQNAEYTILEGVTIIEGQAFYNCSSLINIIIPKGVTSIGNSAFYGCSSLTSITIPEGVTSIGKYAFYNCRSLVNIIIPEGVTNIGDYAFCSCSSLTNITIPEGVTSIGENVFRRCSKLKIYCKSDTYAKKYAEENKISYSIDDEAPTITSVTGNETWQKEIKLTINAEDNQSGLAYKAYSFDNGQTWQKENTKTYTENTNGIIIKVKDALGNIATYDSIDIDKILKINITDYEEITKENKKYITKITQNTTIQQLKEKIETNGTVKIYKGDNEITEEEALVGTGMTMQIENENYVLVVRGDINGDGKISLVDLANLKLSMVGKRTLNTASAIAGDINGDGNTSLNDLVKLKMYLVGKIII